MPTVFGVIVASVGSRLCRTACIRGVDGGDSSESESESTSVEEDGRFSTAVAKVSTELARDCERTIPVGIRNEDGAGREFVDVGGGGECVAWVE